MIKGTIFDVDGVILDSMMVWRDAFDRFLAQYDRQAEPGLHNKILKMTFEESAEYFKNTYHLPLTGHEILEGIFNTVHGFYRDEVQLKPGASELLERLHDDGISMTIATSGERRNVVAAFTRLGILEYFDRIFTCVELGTGKCRPDIYLAAAASMNAAPSECVVFEDALYAVKTCCDAGFNVFGVYDRSSDADEGKIRDLCDTYLENYDDAVEILKKIKSIT